MRRLKRPTAVNAWSGACSTAGETRKGEKLIVVATAGKDKREGELRGEQRPPSKVRSWPGHEWQLGGTARPVSPSSADTCGCSKAAERWWCQHATFCSAVWERGALSQTLSLPIVEAPHTLVVVTASDGYPSACC